MATPDEQLVEQLHELTQATTELIDATNIGKKRLDDAEKNSVDAAKRANADAKQVAADKSDAINACNEAKAAEKKATGIVTGDAGSEKPAAGKLAQGNDKGHLDIGWTPLLQAMYPHSGIIGSVDKLDLFSFSQTSADSNKIKVKKRAFNINGRFVEIPAQIITLPEAESTPERAVAFDDIFIDWNGQIQTYRSITPHRTVTSFDRDAIASEHGYTKVQKGLYKSGDTYALLLCRVARRNKGIYHPLYNPEGTANQHKSGKWNQPWFKKSHAGIPITSPLNNAGNCFTSPHEFNAGAIGVDAAGRPDGKYYDAIYADDVTPLYCSSAKNVIDRDALLFDSFNKAVAGETFSAAEGTSKGYQYKIRSVSHIENESNTGNNFVCIYLYAPFDSRKGKTSILFDNCLINGKRLDALLNTVVTSSTGTGANNRIKVRVNSDTSKNISKGNTLLVLNSHPYKAHKSTQDSARPYFTQCDIFGSLNAMPDEWKTEGIPGDWLAGGEQDRSKKILECHLVLKTSDKGQTWSDVTSTYKQALESNTNQSGSSFSDNECVMFFYKASANPFELVPYSGSTVFSISPMFRILQTHVGVRGSNFVASLIDKVPTGLCELYQTLQNYLLSEHPFFNSTKSPEHESINFTGFDKTTTVKAFAYLSKVANTATLNIFYKELKHNGTQWGDDNKFNIVDNQTTVTDLNGNSVIVGQKRVELPYHFDGEQY